MPPVPVEWLMGFYIANQIASAFVQALPQPSTDSSKMYIFIYKFANLLVADFKSFADKIPPPTVTKTTGQLTTTETPATSASVATNN